MSSKADPIDLASTEAPVTLLEEPPRAQNAVNLLQLPETLAVYEGGSRQ